MRTLINHLSEKWGSPWLTHQPIMSRFAARGNEVWYCLPEPTLDQVLAGESAPGGVAAVHPGVSEWTPPRLFPKIFVSKAVDRVMSWMRARCLRRELALRAGERVAVIWNPLFVDRIGMAGEDISLFYCHDHYPDFYPEGSSERAVAEEQFGRLIDRADAVIVCSERLLELVSKVRRDSVHLIENGVDVDAYRAAQGSAPPPEMADLKRPIAGHIGRINKKIDMDALEELATAKPDWSVVLMGPLTGWSSEHEERFKKLRALPNFRYIGGKPASELPRYTEALDVGLMCYRKKGTWVSYGFPLKLFEYFSLGKPCVGTDLDAVCKYRPFVRTVGDGESWVRAVEAALTDPQGYRAKRIELAMANSWDIRVDRLESIMGEALKKKGART